VKINPTNERIKHRYFEFMREARQLGEQSIDQAAKALDRFEEYTKRRSFREFRTEQAVSFKRRLAAENGKRSGMRLSKATVSSTLNSLREFFEWLSSQRGYRKISRTDAAYFKPSRADEAVARARRQGPVPTLEQVRRMISVMPAASDIDLRNRALIAITIVTGARDNAVASLKLKHLDIEDSQLFQDARDVRTKFRSTFPTWFFPVGDDFVAVVREWKSYLEQQLDFGPEDPLFPQSTSAFGAGGIAATSRLARTGWANADPIRAVFKQACAAAGLPSFTPHSFRHTLAVLGEDVCTSPAHFKAWSQNLGHKDTLVTLTSYGTLPGHTQKKLISELWAAVKVVTVT
jgi:integrase/recombinase XerD